MQVGIDGIAYAPVTEQASNIGIAISTHNRHDVLSRALEHQLKFLPAGALVVVIDDGSGVPVSVPACVSVSTPATSNAQNAAGRGGLMPARIPRACRKLGCARTTTDGSGYCDAHRNEGWQQHQRGQSRHERGYGSKWDVIRVRILHRDHHLCQSCLKNGRPTAAKTVDHIIPKAHGGTDEYSNLQSLCWACHKTKTAHDRYFKK